MSRPAGALWFDARRREDAAERWAAEPFDVSVLSDGSRVTFNGIRSQSAWAAAGRIGDAWVVVSREGAPPSELELRVLDDPAAL